MNQHTTLPRPGCSGRVSTSNSPDADAERWQAVLRRERGVSANSFVYGVRSTGVYCRTYCPSKRPAREQVSFFAAPADAEAAGFRPCLRCHPTALGVALGERAVLQACRVLDSQFDEPWTLRALADSVGLSPEHFQRTFRRIVGVSPREYASARRMERFRTGLQSGEQVGQALVEAGYGSTSRIYEHKKAESQLGVAPGAYKKERLTMAVRYVIADSPHGAVLIAATERGVCSITLGADAGVLIEALNEEFPRAALAEGGDVAHGLLGDAAAAIARHLDGMEPNLRLPLDVRATAFQWRVWEALQAIPYGETRSYSDIAEKIGRPSAARAVAQACASNPVALAVPCHRVVRSGGEISGYRWGVERKAAILAAERGNEPEAGTG